MWQHPYSNFGKISACLKWEKRLLPQICNDNCAAAKAACECWLLAFEKLQDWISDIVHALTKPNSAGWFRKIAKGVVDTDNNKSNAHHRNSTTATTAMALLLIAVLHFGLYIAFAIKVMCLKRHLALSSKLEVRFDKPFLRQFIFCYIFLKLKLRTWGYFMMSASKSCHGLLPVRIGMHDREKQQRRQDRRGLI